MFASLHFAAGEEVVLEERLRALKQMGYERVHKADMQSTYTHRGGILDIFPWGHSFPVRVEFVGDQVEMIHTFDPSTGALLEPHQMVVILPVGDRAIRRPGQATIWNWGEKPVNPFVDLENGDLVVHVAHGIGRFRGIEKITPVGGKVQQHLRIEYAEKEKLYVPLTDLHLVQRYVALGLREKRKIDVKLSKLGSKMWPKIRERARKGILSYASELLDLQAKRRLVPGYAFGADNDWQKKMEAEFPYTETPDQERAVEAVKRDMEAPRPMDRLICGDVGYGKTEVAIRAAFKAVMNGKQVAMLVPTTILCEQHFENFRDRFKNFEASVEMLSRFQTAGEQRDIIKRTAAGSVDMLIGTHRMLSKDVSFKNLGLLIIDEEQRFGVQHKERLKCFRLEVDVLTMTATPIPRTLYFSLVGGKDMSQIQTPPQNRIPIKTYIVETSDKIIREGIEFELARGGQVFFVHNRVHDIEMFANKIRMLAPEARVAIGHGQMHPKELEDVMHRFIHKEVDVLVSTTIVESGIDIPNANTLFIDRADAFGLSELYQLKGRVGRFTREAHAYFLIPKGAALSHESQRRLTAIERHGHLGAGFNIAMEDLEIRGGGNLLGTEQSGFMTAIGFDLYCRLLKDAIDSLGKTKEFKPVAVPASNHYN